MCLWHAVQVTEELNALKQNEQGEWLPDCRQIRHQKWETDWYLVRWAQQHHSEASIVCFFFLWFCNFSRTALLLECVATGRNGCDKKVKKGLAWAPYPVATASGLPSILLPYPLLGTC